MEIFEDDVNNFIGAENSSSPFYTTTPTVRESLHTHPTL